MEITGTHVSQCINHGLLCLFMVSNVLRVDLGLLLLKVLICLFLLFYFYDKNRIFFLISFVFQNLPFWVLIKFVWSFFLYIYFDYSELGFLVYSKIYPFGLTLCFVSGAVVVLQFLHWCIWTYYTVFLAGIMKFMSETLICKLFLFYVQSY